MTHGHEGWGEALQFCLFDMDYMNNHIPWGGSLENYNFSWIGLS